MNARQCRARLLEARVARLATVSPDGHPHIVPITFALFAPDQIVFAVDHKPKRTTALKRLANIAANPLVSVLVDYYEDDWSELWWVRADGRAAVVRDGKLREGSLEAIVERYPQYRERRPEGPVVAIGVQRWSGWAFTR